MSLAQLNAETIFHYHLLSSVIHELIYFLQEKAFLDLTAGEDQSFVMNFCCEWQEFEDYFTYAEIY